MATASSCHSLAVEKVGALSQPVRGAARWHRCVFTFLKVCVTALAIATILGFWMLLHERYLVRQCTVAQVPSVGVCEAHFLDHDVPGGKVSPAVAEPVGKGGRLTALPSRLSSGRGHAHHDTTHDHVGQSHSVSRLNSKPEGDGYHAKEASHGKQHSVCTQRGNCSDTTAVREVVGVVVDLVFFFSMYRAWYGTYLTITEHFTAARWCMWLATLPALLNALVVAVLVSTDFMLDARVRVGRLLAQVSMDMTQCGMVVLACSLHRRGATPRVAPEDDCWAVGTDHSEVCVDVSQDYSSEV